MFWDPVLIVRTGGSDGSRTNKPDLVGVGALGLGDDGGEPGVVDEKARGPEAGCENEVQEETVWDVSVGHRGGGSVWIYAYIWGSRREVGASTTEMVWL